jgi:hypothetical protein
LIAIAALLAGVLVGALWRGEDAHAQVSRFRTERQGELLLIRYLNGTTGVECYLGTDGAGIISIPCDRQDRELSRQ